MSLNRSMVSGTPRRVGNRTVTREGRWVTPVRKGSSLTPAISGGIVWDSTSMESRAPPMPDTR